MTVQEFYANGNGWCQGSLHNNQGQRCLVGALIHCYGDYTEEMIAALRKVESTLRQSFCFTQTVVAFNDMRGMTEGQIKKVAKLAGV